MKKFFTLVVACLFIGCSTGPHWVQAGKTKQDMKYDRIDCYDNLIKGHNQFAGLTDMQIEDLMAQCMNAKGYHDESKAKH